MNFGPDEAIGVSKIGTVAARALEFFTSARVRARITPDGAHELLPVTVDPVLSSSGIYLYGKKDDVDGKMHLYARFPTGTVQIVATEPD
jgi:hypothetical protein